MKRCTRCHQEKPEEEFPIQRRVRSGRSAQCKKCHREWMQEHYLPSPRRTVPMPAAPKPSPVDSTNWRSICCYHRWGADPCMKPATHRCPYGIWRACTEHQLPGDELIP